MDGIPATVTIILPWAEYERSAQARRHYDGLLAWDDSERARTFKALPDAERHELVRRIMRIRDHPNASESTSSGSAKRSASRRT
jgi:hypothetical protein